VAYLVLKDDDRRRIYATAGFAGLRRSVPGPGRIVALYHRSSTSYQIR
jgi:hypothetical protein